MSTIEKIEPKIHISFKEQLKTVVEPESQVIIHITFENRTEEMLIRIWPTTHLFPLHSNHICDLLFAENITLHPYWTQVPAKSSHTFTLIFSGLPKGCKHFDMAEVIPESGGFEFKNIERNKSDVYHLKM